MQKFIHVLHRPLGILHEVPGLGFNIFPGAKGHQRCRGRTAKTRNRRNRIVDALIASSPPKIFMA